MKKITVNLLIEILCALVLVCGILFIVFYYAKIPTIIPIHYSLSDQPDAYGSKSNVWFIVAIEVITYVGMSFLQKYPHKFNYPVQVTESNKERLFMLGVRIILLMKLCIVVLYTYIIFNMTGIIAMDLTLMTIGLLVFAIVLPIIFIAKMKKVQ